MSTAVKITDLTKKYGDLVAVDAVSFSVDTGEIFGLLGPNGAGKTTTVEMIEGLRKPDAGSIEVCGVDALKEQHKLKELIGVQLQSTTLYDKIKVREAIDLFGGYYQQSVSADQLMEEMSIADKQDSYVEKLSGGQKQRVALTLALVNDPEVIFLDEPTTGLDPQARRNVWDVIEGLKKKGKTLILTTHYMEEAERLCHRVGIIDHGKIIALDSPRNLIVNADIESTVEVTCGDDSAETIFKSLASVSKVIRQDNLYTLYTRESSKVLRELTGIAEDKGMHLEGISARQGTLEDVFLLLTGRRLRD